MFIQFGQALGDYLYDVFVAKFDFWLAFGLLAQLFFTARFLKQSRLAGESRAPANQLSGNSSRQSVMYLPPNTPSASICLGVSSGRNSASKLRPAATVSA